MDGNETMDAVTAWSADVAYKADYNGDGTFDNHELNGDGVIDAIEWAATP